MEKVNCGQIWWVHRNQHCALRVSQTQYDRKRTRIQIIEWVNSRLFSERNTPTQPHHIQCSLLSTHPARVFLTKLINLLLLLTIGTCDRSDENKSRQWKPCWVCTLYEVPIQTFIGLGYSHVMLMHENSIIDGQQKIEIYWSFPNTFWIHFNWRK